MIPRQCEVALVLDLFGTLHELLSTFPFVGLRRVALGRFFPGSDLLFLGSAGFGIGDQRKIELPRFRGS